MLCRPADAVMRPAAPSEPDHSPRNRPSIAQVGVQPARTRRWSGPARPCATSSSASTSGWASRQRLEPPGPGVGHLDADHPQHATRTWVGLRRSKPTALRDAAGAPLRRARRASAVASPSVAGSRADVARHERFGRRPVHRQSVGRAARRTATRRSTLRGPSGPPWSEGRRCRALRARRVAARPRGATPLPSMARRSGESAQPPSVHSGFRWPSAWTGSDGSGSSSSWWNRSTGRAVGRSAVERPCSRAQIRPGSACHPPTSSRCTAATSQLRDTRIPASTSWFAVAEDHMTHRGERSRSTAAMSPRSTCNAPDVGVARTVTLPSTMTIATGSPDSTPAPHSTPTASSEPGGRVTSKS